MLKKIISGVVLGGMLLQSIPVLADYRAVNGHEIRKNQQHYKGHLPPGYVALATHGGTYLYSKGLFYRPSHAGYIMARPPSGIIVPALPRGYRTVMVRQTPYYYYENVYYTEAPSGYVVAAPPPVVESVPVMTVEPETNIQAPTNIDSYDIYIPNDNGSYTLVTLKKGDKGGFIGPQAEYYPEHPTVEQLKALYGVGKK